MGTEMLFQVLDWETFFLNRLFFISEILFFSWNNWLRRKDSGENKNGVKELRILMMFKYLWDYGEFWSVEAEIMNSVIGMQQCRMFTKYLFWATFIIYNRFFIPGILCFNWIRTILIS